MNTPHVPSVSRRRFLGQVSAAAALALSPRLLRAQAPAGKKLGVALAGLGGYSRGQLGPGLRLTQHCRLMGVVTGDRAKGQQWAKDYGFPEKNIWHYDTMQEMRDNPDIDIIYVVTPPGLHAQHAIAAARAGKHVICEKPMANTVAECDAIIAACREAGVKLSIGYRLHFDPYHEVLRQLVRTNEFGPFMKLDGGFAFTMGNRRPWRVEKKLAGGGPLMDVGVYVIQEMCMAAGAAPVAITARELPKKRPDFFNEVEETIEWTAEFANGARGTGYSSYNDNRNDFRADAAGGWFRIAPAYSYGGLAGETSKGPIQVTPPQSQQALQMDDFAVCVRDGKDSRVPGEMGRRDMVIVEAIYASAAAGGKRLELKY
ncbi:MAG TPA: Gfo/Idh/MocA family oxidoreductase [Opitutaceae bacterium]|nr:Gfo/Idh/MocA family oxidoreductase [Opitutaceae bacterium]